MRRAPDEAHWPLLLLVALPLVGMIFAVVIPWLARQGWWWTRGIGPRTDPLPFPRDDGIVVVRV